MNRPGPGPQRPPPNLSSQPMATQYRGGPFQQQQQQYALPQQQRAGAGVLGQFPPLTAAQAAAAAHRGPAGQPQAREFDPNEFPALGAPNQQSQTPGEQPGALNGFGAQDSRQSVLGALQGGQQPGLVNLGQQRLQQQFASDADKRNYGLPSSKAGNAAVAAAWNAPAVPPGLHQNGVGAHHNLSGPPGISIPYPSHAQQQQQQQHVQQQPIQPTSSVAVQQPLSSAARDGPAGLHSFANAVSEARASPQQQTGTIQSGATQGGLPQTPAQQILVSPADRWGLMGLLALIKATDPDVNLLSYGQDLGTMGMDMNAQGHISGSFITPWSDSSAAHTVEPDFHLPSCYNVHTSPPNAAKAAAFSDETLFFMFYASPRDSLQEIAAQELYSRLWRFHKEQRVWITKDQQSPPSSKIQGGEIGVYLLFDPDNWERKRQEMTVLYADLEERPTPQFSQQQPAPPQQQHNNQAVFAQQQTPAPVQQGFAQQQQTQGLQHLGMGGQQRFHGLGMTQVAGM